MADESKSRCESLRNWIGSPTFYICLNFFLGAWGDRMWMFSVGMYLVILAGGVLRLAAVYSLAGSCCFLLFGGILGDWVDKNGRLKVVRVTLVIQNSCVMLSAVAVALALKFTEEIYNHTGLKVLTEAAIVTFAVIAQLASMTYHIAIEKDWIVKIAGGKSSTLANLNAVIRSIDLSCKILAPAVCGFIMYYASMFVSALVIVGWNIVSVVLEYGLLAKVYRMVPGLAVKTSEEDIDQKKEGSESEREQLTKQSEKTGLEENDESMTEKTELNGKCDCKQKTADKTGDEEEKSCMGRMVEPFVTLVRSWKTYSKQPVAFAGLSLSFLYMTVLGFDSITVGFVYCNGVSESMTGVSMALAGLFGIIGTFLYTRLRKILGLEKTGLLSFSFQISCLIMCVMSLFTPGTLFEPTFNPWEGNNTSICVSRDSADLSVVTDTVLNTSHPINDTHKVVKRHAREIMATDQHLILMDEPNMNYLSSIMSGHHSQGFTHFAFLHEEYQFSHEVRKATNPAIFDSELRNSLLVSDHVIHKRNVVELNEDPRDAPQKYEGFNYSVVLLLAGIVISRIGLWVSDLVVTQTMQENVAENERGVVNGIQGSLNMLMDILKNVLVIVVPHIQTFGYLIILSFLFVLSGGCLFFVHCYRFRRQMFRDCCSCCCCCGTDGNREKVSENGGPDTKKAALAIETNVV